MSLDDFAVLIGWSGPEDKPLYRALLVSPAREAQIERKPFWGYAVISERELDRLTDALAAQGCPATAGPYTGEGSEYYVEIERAGATTSYALGFDSDTAASLRAIAAALDADHREPVEAIIARIGGSD